MKNYSYTFIHFSLWVISVVLVMNDLDGTSWILINSSIFIGLFGPVLLWLKTKFKIIGFYIAFLKLSLTFYFTWGWWQLTYSTELTVDGAGFFWGMSPFLLVLGFFEALIINNYAIKKT